MREIKKTAVLMKTKGAPLGDIRVFIWHSASKIGLITGSGDEIYEVHLVETGETIGFDGNDYFYRRASSLPA